MMVGTFKVLPIEILQMIALHTTSDADLARFRLICVDTRNAVDSDGATFWRRRFLATFDPPRSESVEGTLERSTKRRKPVNQWYKGKYQALRMMLRTGADFRNAGNSAKENYYLVLLRDLAVDSYNQADGDSKNIAQITRFLKSFGLLRTVFRITQGNKTGLGLTNLYSAVCLLFTHHSFTENEMFSFDVSQQMVYACADAQPVITGPTGTQVNLIWLLHIANFFRYHLTRESEGTLYSAFTALRVDERPRCWSSKLENGAQALGRCWKGTYAFIHAEEMSAMRRGENENMPFLDQLNTEQDMNGFQNLELEFFESPADFIWLPLFENVLPSRVQHKQPRTRAQLRAVGEVSSDEQISLKLKGQGQDGDRLFSTSGWLNPLSLQQGIPGWQRFTMIKYYEDDFGQPDVDDLWAYEGVVLPGNQIILGRWFSPDGLTNNQQYSGPFLLWNVDDRS